MDAREKTRGQQFHYPEQMLFEAGYGLKCVPGEMTNIKITTEWDWLIARKVILPMFPELG